MWTKDVGEKCKRKGRNSEKEFFGKRLALTIRNYVKSWRRKFMARRNAYKYPPRIPLVPILVQT